MSKSITDIAKKRGRPKTTGLGQAVLVRLQTPELPALDAWIAEQPEPRPSRPEAMRVALKDWLKGLGRLPHTNDREDQH